MPEIAIDGTRLFYGSVGTGRTIVCLHGGLGMDHTYFRPDFDRLAELGRVIFLDHRGNGRSGRTDDPVTIELLADDAAAAIAALGPPATVIGHSFGGFIAQELAATHPDAVERLVLVSTTPGQPGDADDPEADPGPPPPAELTALFSARPTSDDEYAELVGRLVPFYVKGDADVLRDRMAATIYRVQAMLEGFVSLATWSVVDRLAGVEVPTLLLVGEHDQFTSRQQSERLARLMPRADLHVFERSGHFPWLEEADAFFATLEHWLAP